MKDKIKAIIRETYEIDRWGITAHKALAAVLANWKGKKLNKRVVAQLREKFTPDPAAAAKAVYYWSNEYGMINVCLWGIGPWPDHSKRLSMLVAYTTRPSEPKLIGAYSDDYDPASFEYADNCHGNAAISRNEQRLALLADDAYLDRLSAVIEAHNTAKQRFAELTEWETLGNVDKYRFEELLNA